MCAPPWNPRIKEGALPRGESAHPVALSWPLEVAAEPEVVLNLDEQVGRPDRATAGVQPAVQFDEADRLRRGQGARRTTPAASVIASWSGSRFDKHLLLT